FGVACNELLLYFERRFTAKGNNAVAVVIVEVVRERLAADTESKVLVARDVDFGQAFADAEEFGKAALVSWRSVAFLLGRHYLSDLSATALSFSTVAQLRAVMASPTVRFTASSISLARIPSGHHR